MRRILLFSIASVLVLGRMTAKADDNDWVYTPETHVTTAPATADGVMYGLDARPRGLGDSMSITVDKWIWSSVWAIRELSFRLSGTILILK